MIPALVAAAGSAIILGASGMGRTDERVSAAPRPAAAQPARCPPSNYFIIQMKDLDGSRISTNFDHRRWVSKDNRCAKVRITICGVPQHIKSGLRLVMRGDKKHNHDSDRSGVLKDGDVFILAYGEDVDRAYFFEERGSKLAQALPAGACIRLDRVP